LQSKAVGFDWLDGLLFCLAVVGLLLVGWFGWWVNVFALSACPRIVCLSSIYLTVLVSRFLVIGPHWFDQHEPHFFAWLVARVVCQWAFAWLLVLFSGTICQYWFLRVFGGTR
jgi:hypothetical protein